MNKVKSVIKGAWMVLAGVLLGGPFFTPLRRHAGCASKSHAAIAE